jgi:hypothetical protein
MADATGRPVDGQSSRQLPPTPAKPLPDLDGGMGYPGRVSVESFLYWKRRAEAAEARCLRLESELDVLRGRSRGTP